MTIVHLSNAFCDPLPVEEALLQGFERTIAKHLRHLDQTEARVNVAAATPLAPTASNAPSAAAPHRSSSGAQPHPYAPGSSAAAALGGGGSARTTTASLRGVGAAAPVSVRTASGSVVSVSPNTTPAASRSASSQQQQQAHHRVMPNANVSSAGFSQPLARHVQQPQLYSANAAPLQQPHQHGSSAASSFSAGLRSGNISAANNPPQQPRMRF